MNMLKGVLVSGGIALLGTIPNLYAQTTYLQTVGWFATIVGVFCMGIFLGKGNTPVK